MIPPSIASRLTQPFSDTQFTPTKFTSCQEKAKFANALTRFIASDFPLSGFTRKLYGRLSCSFGHIAHYSRLDSTSIFSKTFKARSPFSKKPFSHRRSAIPPIPFRTSNASCRSACALATCSESTGWHANPRSAAAIASSMSVWPRNTRAPPLWSAPPRPSLMSIPSPNPIDAAPSRSR